MKTKTIPPVRLDFRNEAYGFVYRPVAFRFGYMGEFSETRRNKILAKVRKQGFAYSHLRESWIKEDVSDPAAEAQRLVVALAGAGHKVETNMFFANLVPDQRSGTKDDGTLLTDG
ncbi:hypothetical protein IC232_03380 [Microvirga sp. BT688]|uniref:hypothetical protein n=1 Tax=Microvirga sp. TaxID=1873136 RepID=UPI0016824B75|nr:hypothetical protein [Microvirga sp.]MBD2745731.1 hypothetical protein [Microvirga sp.]